MLCLKRIFPEQRSVLEQRIVPAPSLPCFGRSTAFVSRKGAKSSTLSSDRRGDAVGAASSRDYCIQANPIPLRGKGKYMYTCCHSRTPKAGIHGIFGVIPACLKRESMVYLLSFPHA
jgi:hypothetical protein